MGRQFARRKRRRPRRGRRYRGNGLPGRGHSFQGFRIRELYDGGMALGYGLVGALFGWGMAGLFGVLPGFGIGMVLSARSLGTKGHDRP